jgi:hypothetical protein
MQLRHMIKMNLKDSKGHLSKLFKFFFITLKHDIVFFYWHTKIHYNYSDVHRRKMQSCHLDSFESLMFLCGTTIVIN